jgi:hypothetical protein
MPSLVTCVRRSRKVRCTELCQKSEKFGAHPCMDHENVGKHLPAHQKTSRTIASRQPFSNGEASCRLAPMEKSPTVARIRNGHDGSRVARDRSGRRDESPGRDHDERTAVARQAVETAQEIVAGVERIIPVRAHENPAALVEPGRRLGARDRDHDRSRWSRSPWTGRRDGNGLGIAVRCEKGHDGHGSGVLRHVAGSGKRVLYEFTIPARVWRRGLPRVLSPVIHQFLPLLW